MSNKELSENNRFYKDKVSLLNIDSFYRNKIPRNIVDSNINFLSNSAISTTRDSKIVRINFQNNNLNINDRIVLRNVNSLSKKLHNSIFIISNFPYFVVNFPNHGLNSNYLNFSDYISVSINKVTNQNQIYPISSNSIYGNKNAIYISESIVLPNNLLNLLNINFTTFQKDYFLVKLDKTYYGETDQLFYIDNIVEIKFDDIGGIPLSFINADYPVTNKRRQGFHNIINSTNDYIEIEVSIKAYKTESGGLDKITISKVLNTIPGFPNSNEYTIFLKNSYTNVSKIELISSEFSYSDYLIKSSGNNKNNLIFWKIFDTGDIEYMAEISEGNYNSNQLLDEIKNKMNNELKNNINKNNNFDIKLEINTQSVIFEAFSIEVYPNSLAIIKSIIDNEELYLLKLNYENQIDIGDFITISGSDNIGAVPKSVINRKHIVYDKNFVDGSFTIVINSFNPIKSKILNDGKYDLSGAGGNQVTIKSPIKFSLLFNKKNTIGTILGFNNVGEDYAVTPFKKVTTNSDEYENQRGFNLDFVGNKRYEKNVINLTGGKNYLLMYLNDYEVISNMNNISSCFAKILFPGKPGDILFNTYINTEYIFDIPIASISEFSLKFVYPDGSLVDFRNLNHSFTLKITEIREISKDTNLESKKFTYPDYMEKIEKTSDLFK